jgi:hypothetical protein
VEEPKTNQYRIFRIFSQCKATLVYLRKSVSVNYGSDIRVVKDSKGNVISDSSKSKDVSLAHFLENYERQMGFSSIRGWDSQKTCLI